MDAKARKALSVIRRSVDDGRYQLTMHFTQRMDQRGFFWPDVLEVLDDPAGVRSGGTDRYERPKWLLAGTATDGRELEFVCVLDVDEHGDVTVFITIY